MLKMISWHDFLTTIAVLTVFYYLAVLTLFYKQDILALAQGKNPGQQPGGEKKEEKPELFKATEKAISVLTSALQEVKIGGGNKTQLMAAAKATLKKYDYLKGTPYAIAVNHFLLRETSNSIPLTEEEIRELWE